jgi:hypothetical protein
MAGDENTFDDSVVYLDAEKELAKISKIKSASAPGSKLPSRSNSPTRSANKENIPTQEALFRSRRRSLAPKDPNARKIFL